MKKILTIMLFILASFNQNLIAGKCFLIAEHLKYGYCAEGVDGKGKCVKLKIGDERCTFDEATVQTLL